jgi:ubiquinone/menaquinone biosynthesis C-methylase UbiE
MSKTGFEQLNEILRAYRKSEVLFVAHELGVLNKIGQQPTDSETLVKDLELSKIGLERLLSALCATGIVVKEKEQYSLSIDFRPYLNPDSTKYMGGLINHEIHLHKRWNRLSESVKSGKPVKKSDEPSSPEDTERFIQAMTVIGNRTAPILMKKIAFKGNEQLLDLGGGPGKYVELFCESYPDMQVTLFDQPDTIRVAQSNLSNHPNFNNMRFITGNILADNLDENYDVIFSSNFIHIFGPADIQMIFNKCHRALKPGGRLLIKDFFLNEDLTGPEFSTLFSLHMLLSTEGGQCYSEKKMISLMEDSNFSYGQSVNLTESSMVIEGIK